MSEADGRRLFTSVSRRIIVRGWIANAIGAVVVFIAIGFLAAVFFDPQQRDELGRENLPIMFPCVIALGLIITPALRRRRHRALAWLLEDREPSEEEYRLTLGLPAYGALLTAAAWGIGGLVGGIINLDHSLGSAVLIATAVGLGGEATSALTFLLSQRGLRPITARALTAREPERSAAPGIRERLLFAWSLGTGVPVMSVIVVGVVGLSKPGVEIESVAAACVFLGGVAMAVGLLATVMTARAIADPVTAVRTGLEGIGRGEFETKVEVDDASEIGLLQAGFNRMAEGLAERERIRDLFGRQVGRDVARAALHGGTRLGGEEREVGALFVDLTGSTSMALAMPPTEVVRLLNRFFRVVVEVTEEQGGLVNKFEGDAALCVFGAPVESADPAGDALRTARLLAERLAREVPEIGFGIGVSAGSAVAGNVGSEQRFEYTVIGDPVNEAARLSDLAKEREVNVLASDAALDRAAPGETEAWEQGERTVLRGRLDATGLASPRS
jgi:adenylate cyclase